MSLLLASCIAYYPCNLNRTWEAFGVFLQTWLLIHLTAACFSKVSMSTMAHSVRTPHNRIALSMVSIFCLMILYAGFIYNLGELPHDKVFLRDFSMYYWVRNNCY